MADVSGEKRSSEEVSSETKSSFIHSTAIVHPNAVIDQDVTVGPFCTVGSMVRIGKACKLHPGWCHCWRGYSRRTTIGCNNIIGHHAVVGVKCQDMKYKVIGDNNLIMGSCHIAHDCKLGNNVIFANSTLIAGHVAVEDYAHTAGAVVVHQFCHLGSHSFIGGGSVVSQDVPKYMMVTDDRANLCGLNLEGLRRAVDSPVKSCFSGVIAYC
ncbi:hypothetical protein MKX03_017661 [Papaver bracteatum]|nr:hypothetical protein MKX03_017661 [Papaver bracteatum]